MSHPLSETSPSCLLRAYAPALDSLPFCTSRLRRECFSPERTTTLSKRLSLHGSRTLPGIHFDNPEISARQAKRGKCLCSLTLTGQCRLPSRRAHDVKSRFGAYLRPYVVRHSCWAFRTKLTVIPEERDRSFRRNVTDDRHGRSRCEVGGHAAATVTFLGTVVATSGLFGAPSRFGLFRTLVQRPAILRFIQRLPACTVAHLEPTVMGGRRTNLKTTCRPTQLGERRLYLKSRHCGQGSSSRGSGLIALKKALPDGFDDGLNLRGRFLMRASHDLFGGVDFPMRPI